MNILKNDFGEWHIEYVPDDGARIAVLRFEGQDLLTSKPFRFRSPEIFFGEYETRPVYGYDDCFPTVDGCKYPGQNYECRDHGEVCWQHWHTEVKESSLICSTECLRPAVEFKRVLNFEGNRLRWRFEVKSYSGERSVFIHVMHALLPLQLITSVEFPACRQIFDEIKSEETGLKSSAEFGEYLLAFQPGSFGMYLLKEINDGVLGLRFRNGMKLEIMFDKKMFPTLGVWWNNGGYPESGLLRSECAFEPIPGTSSDLSKSFRDGVYLSVGPDSPLIWEIIWNMF